MQEAKANTLLEFLEAPKVLKDVDLAGKARFSFKLHHLLFEALLCMNSFAGHLGRILAQERAVCCCF